MELTENGQYFGFTLEKTEEVEEIHSTAFLFAHRASGARLLYLKNTDNNKVFNVACKTPPADDCGTPHILEHSVLCGSRKYEAKDPFNELAKGSLHTFLNAMTYADKTMYPVASCNETDFHHLMDVYLDAVFFPKIYEKKEIFQQEGWRYQFQDPAALPEVTGIVFNEMKGALADPESQLSGVIARAVFGETVYGFESGGEPSAIPDLTYEAFLDFHRKYYHPSNAYFYLYGDMDVLPCLQQIADGYLSAFSKTDDLPVIPETPCARKGEICRETYPAAEEGEGAYLAYTVKAGKCTDPERVMALQLLSYVLLETNASPIKTALLDAQICEETEGWFDSSTYEMLFSIIAKNADAEKIDAFCQIIEDTLQDLAQNGIPQELLAGALRKYEFRLREEDFGTTPRGLIYCTRLMKSWLHGENPCDSLRQRTIVEGLKAKSKKGYFEALLEDVFLSNTNKTYVVFAPEKGKAQKEAAAFAEKMAARRAAMTDADLAEIAADAARLERFQTQADTPEILAQIPQLALSEIDPAPKTTPYQTECLPNGRELLLVPLQSNGLHYVKLHFDTSAIPWERVPYLGLLAAVLGKLDTAQYPFQALPNVMNQVFGSFSLSHSAYRENATAHTSFLTVKAKLLREDSEAALAMVREILFHTRFDHVENLKKLIKSKKIDLEYVMQNHAHTFALFYSGSALFSGMRMEEHTSGIRFYRFLCDVAVQLEKDPQPVVGALRETAEMLFCQEAAAVSFGCEEADFPDARRMAGAFLAELPQGALPQAVYPIALGAEKAAFTSSGGVMYHIASFDAKQAGFAYHGKYQVLRTVLNLEYLWNQIRVQGGAYGCGCNFTRSGFCYFYSYRDPNLVKTYDVYEKLYANIAAFSADEKEMTKYILGTINRLDQPMTNTDLFDDCIQRHYQGVSDADLAQERTEILRTTAADIRSCEPLLRRMVCDNICSIGNAEVLRENAARFTKIEPLIP